MKPTNEEAVMKAKADSKKKRGPQVFSLTDNQ